MRWPCVHYFPSYVAVSCTTLASIWPVQIQTVPTHTRRLDVSSSFIHLFHSLDARSVGVNPILKHWFSLFQNWMTIHFGFYLILCCLSIFKGYLSKIAILRTYIREARLENVPNWYHGNFSSSFMNGFQVILTNVLHACPCPYPLTKIKA